MNKSDLENTLSKLALKPPSSTYVAEAERILQHSKPQSGHRWWNKALAAGLMLSLVVNVWQYQSAQQGHAKSASSEDKPSSGGYSLVSEDTSPDGHHQSYTVIWEHKS